MKKSKQVKGFTIIEVVLVLAIAALIFLMVFIAFPALQRSQRNTARKNATSTVLSAVTDYASTHAGALPATSTALDNYVKELDTAGYTVQWTAVGVTPEVAFGTTLDTIEVYTAAKCGTDGKVVKGLDRQYVVVTTLETDIPYCLQG